MQRIFTICGYFSEIHLRAFTIAEALSVTIAEIFFGPIAIITRSISSSMTLAV